MADTKGLRDLSKDSYAGIANIENINTGSMQRIADATERMAVASEAMAKNYLQLQKDLDYYKKRHQELLQQVNGRDNTIKSLKGHITRLKKQVQSVNQTINTQ